MQEQLRQVEDFHRAFRSLIGEGPSFPPTPDRDIRIMLLREEVKELIDELMFGRDLANLAKEMADVAYVLFGTVITYGLQDKFVEVFTAVHQSNMSKLDANGEPIFREDGKVLKSDLYRPADVRSILLK
jgi:predicted HAD superfamily Cof-like phosphohydrolase